MKLGKILLPAAVGWALAIGVAASPIIDFQMGSGQETSTTTAKKKKKAKKKNLVRLCHMPGTPAERTIVVDISAMPAHIDHGDTPGGCD